MLSLTPTKLRDYLTCPQMYKLRHVSRLGGDSDSRALSFGRSLHAALEDLHGGRRGGGGGTAPARPAADPAALLKRHWDAGAYAGPQESDSYFARGCEALRRYAAQASDPGEQVLGTEVFMAYVANLRGLRFRLGCKADRVAVGGDGVLEVLDYKTNASGRLPTRESLASDLPNFLYYVLARIHYPEHRRVRVSLLNVLTLAKVEVEYGESQVAENKRDLVARIRAVASGDFTPAPSEACAWCRVQDHCPLYGREVDLDSVT